MQTIESTLNEKLSSADAAVKAQISNLNLRFPTDADKQTQEYKDQLQTILDSYNLQVESVKADILGFELNIIGGMLNGDDMLGADAVDDLNNIIQTCLNEGIEPAEMDLSRLIELSGNSNLGDVNAGLIQDYLQTVFDQLDLSQFELIEVDGKLQLKLEPEVETTEDTGEKVRETISFQLPDTVDDTVTVQITPQKIIETVDKVMPDEFDVPDTIDKDVIVKLNAAKTVQEQIEIVAEEFGINEEEAATIIWKLTGQKQILNRITITPEMFGIKTSYNVPITFNLTGAANIGGEGFRGGIFGGTSAMGSYARGGIIGDNIPGFSNGGIVRGGSQLIEVAEEGSPEMVIPLSSQRRGRALKLWAQAGHMMGVPGFARGGIIGGDGTSDEGIRFHTIGGEGSSVTQSSQVDVGGITVQINVTAGSNANIADAIREQANEITEVVAGIMAEAIGTQFENTPVRGGAA